MFQRIQAVIKANCGSTKYCWMLSFSYDFIFFSSELSYLTILSNMRTENKTVTDYNNSSYYI